MASLHHFSLQTRLTQGAQVVALDASSSFARVHRAFTRAHQLTVTLESALRHWQALRDASDAQMRQVLRLTHARLTQAGQPRAFIAVRLYRLSDFMRVDVLSRARAALTLCERLRLVSLRDDGVVYLLDALEVVAAQTCERQVHWLQLGQQLHQARTLRHALIAEWNREALPYRALLEGSTPSL